MKIDRLNTLPAMNNNANLIELALPSDDGAKSFGTMLSEAISDVNGLQKSSQAKTIDLAAGRIEDISEVMIAAEKASVALQLTIQVRNKVVEAYQEIMRMPM